MSIIPYQTGAKQLYKQTKYVFKLSSYKNILLSANKSKTLDFLRERNTADFCAAKSHREYHDTFHSALL